MKIFLNEEPCNVNGETLLSVLSELGLSGKKGIAIAVNDTVVSRAEWNETIINDNDKILVISATRGG